MPRDVVALVAFQRSLDNNVLSHAEIEPHLVIDRREGTRRIYQLHPEGLAALRTYLDQFWNQALAAFKATVEQRDEESS